MGIEIAVILSHAWENPDFSHLLTPNCLHYFWEFFVLLFATLMYSSQNFNTTYIYVYYNTMYTNKYYSYYHLVNEQQPEYCVAAKTDSIGRMIKEIQDCKTKLPALCSGSKVADVNTEPSSIHGELSPVWSRCVTCVQGICNLLRFLRLAKYTIL